MRLMSSFANDKWFEKPGGEDWLAHPIPDAIT